MADKPKTKTSEGGGAKFERTSFEPDDTRQVEVANRYLDPIESLCASYPSQSTEKHAKTGKPLATKATHWLNAMISTAIPVWEQHLVDVVADLMRDLGRIPRPDEIAVVMAERHIGLGEVADMAGGSKGHVSITPTVELVS